ncbi:MAG: uvrC [Chloroflexi bacterium]|nr:uvrC [Chloroflexota bacterium]
MNEEGVGVAPAAGFSAAIEETLAKLPAQPGCYLFKDEHGTVLYVGKARSLRDRVRSYFRNPNGLSLKNSHLVQRIAEIDFQILPSENAALLVEFNLIKQYRPKYNILMRDDKSFLSIRITNEPYPRIEAVRHRSDDGARYFGPYTSSQSVYRTLDLLKRLFPYRSCRLNIQPPRSEDGAASPVVPAEEPRRKGLQGRRRRGARLENGPPQERTLTVASPENRPCLEYHIHRCTAPCIDAISQEEYGQIIDQAALFLQGKSDQVTAQLQRAMESAAEELDFERAARLRDQLEAVRKVTERQRVTVLGGHDQDIVGMARAEDETCVELIAVREGRMLGHKQFVLQGTADQNDDAVLAAFLGQYYVATTEIPEEILLPAEPEDIDAIGALLTTQRGRKVNVTVPRRGDKVDLVEVAQENARQAAEGRRHKALTDVQKAAQALDELQAALQLPRLPMRIECYDISNIQGTSTVGSMVVFENGKPKSAAYRRFRIKTVEGSDDFSSLAEMVRRRLKRADSEESSTAAQPSVETQVEGATQPEQNGESEWTRRPDLMIIDGGKGQLNAVLAVLDELGIVDQPIVSLAKQREELFLPGRSDPILLPPTSQALFLVQRIRDEAHRFAITYHRAVRGKRSLESSLDSVPGVGARRKRDLIRHFGSVGALRKANVDDISELPGIGPKTALAIKEYLGES